MSHPGPGGNRERPVQIDYGGAGGHKTQQGCVEQSVCQAREPSNSSMSDTANTVSQTAQEPLKTLAWLKNW